MIEKQVAERFLNKNVVINYRDENNDRITKGLVIQVTESSILINSFGLDQALNLDIINFIREVPNND